MKILITGGNGFLGLHMANFLLKEGHQVRIIDIAPLNAQEFNGSVESILGDVRDTKSVAQAMEGVDTVVHAAAALPLWKKKDIYSVNVEGTNNVLASAHANGVRQVVFVSSTAVYGVPKKIPMEEGDPLSEGVGPYGDSKIIAEKACHTYQGKSMAVSIVRPKTFVGTHRLGVFQILYEWVYQNRKIPVIGSGNNRYQLLEVDDLCSAIYLCLTQNPATANDTFNVGAESFMTVRQDLYEFFQAVGSASRVMGTPRRFTQGLLGFLYTIKLSPLYPWVYATAAKNSFVSVEKIKHTLGWKPQFSNAQALENSYQWYLAHRDEIINSSGVTHRVAWNEGILKLVRKFL